MTTGTAAKKTGRPLKSEANRRYTTEDEIAYINSIGKYQGTVKHTFYTAPPTGMPGTLTLLRNYLNHAENFRTDWTGIDKDRVISAVKRRIRKIEAIAGK